MTRPEEDAATARLYLTPLGQSFMWAVVDGGALNDQPFSRSFLTLCAALMNAIDDGMDLHDPTIDPVHLRFGLDADLFSIE